jgi:anaerobic magnesium-protoporphyrin IX monomethyl ester cyclase
MLSPRPADVGLNGRSARVPPRSGEMRLLLVNVPIRLSAAPCNFPTGLGTVASVLLEAGHEVLVLDANAERSSESEVVDRVVRADADVVALSGLISTYRYQSWLLGELRERLPGTPLVSGGGCATSIPRLMMEHTAAEVLVLGEGEHTILELVEALEGRRALCEVRGIAYRDGGEVRVTEPRPPEPDLDHFPLPAYHLFPTDLYVRNPIWSIPKPSMNLISSRGCPMDCSFCYNLFGRRSYRRRGVDAIVEEVRLLKRRYGVEFFAFVDDNLTIQKPHLQTVCEALAREGVEWGCHGRVDTADDERLALMARSGCRWLGFGIESGSQRILDRMSKRVAVHVAADAIRRTRAHGIFANTTFIFGYPGEDLESIRETMRFKIDLNLLQVDFLATPYPGTPLFEHAQALGRIGDEHAFVLSLNDASDFVVNLTGMSDADLLGLKQQAMAEVRIALFFKLCRDREMEPRRFYATVDDLLQKGFLLPETKGFILLRLAEHLEKDGNLEWARRSRKMAERCLPAPVGAFARATL